MSGLTLGTVPGFVDLPDGLIAANQFAMGLFFQRILDNAKFGIVRPEVFVAQYKHGDTVDVPTSPVDGYQYQRDELIYLWHYVWSGGVSSASSTDATTGITTTTLTANTPSGPGAVWYFEAFVDQSTGTVSSYVKYRNSNNMTGANLSNDGMVEVFTIGVRRKSSLIVSATLPAFSDMADSVFAQDAAVTQALVQTLNHNAKLASLSHEAIYMGEFVNGDVVPLAVSPADGYHYSYAEMTLAWCWRWCSMSASFGDPSGWHGHPNDYFNQLQRVQASIDGTGHVSTAVTFYDNGEITTPYGRLTVVAFCQRRPLATTALANAFTDISDQNMISGAFPKLDTFKAINDAIRFAALRVEYFTADCVNGAVVPLPTSAVDGYHYQRDELTYHYDFGNTGPNSDIRLVSFGASINQSTGAVQTVTNHLHDGGGFKAASDGTVHVLIVARRLHVTPAETDITITIDGGGGGDISAELQNGNFESWSRAGQPTADGWQLFSGDLSGAVVASQVPGIEGAWAQGLYVPVGGDLGITSSKLDAKAGDLRYCGVKIASDVASTGCFYFRVWLYNSDLTNSAWFDLISASPLSGGGAIQQLGCWYEVPQKNATTANTQRGAAPIIGLYDFVCTYSKLEVICYHPSVAVNVKVDSAWWNVQASATTGAIAQRGALALAFFPAISLSITDTTVSFSWPTLQFSDGRVIPAGGSPVLSGLTASTTYALELFWDDLNQAFGGVPGGSGTNGWSHGPADMTANARAYALAWNAASNVPLSQSPIYFTTNASGVGTPTGGHGGGDGGCHRIDVLVREFTRGVIKHLDIRKGNRLWSRAGWLEVLEAEQLPHEDWIHADFEGSVQDLPMTSGHTLEDMEMGAIRAYELSPMTILRTPKGATSPTRIQRFHYAGEIVRLKLEEPCTYYVSMDGVNWIESHNNIQQMLTA